jgi:peroxiredoxin
MRAIRTTLAAAALFATAAAPAAAQSAADILNKFKPTFKGVEYDTPDTPEEVAACKVEQVRNASNAVIGFAVKDGQDRLLRRFVDTNGQVTQRTGESRPQTHLDQWSYYRDGFEVYRELDTNEDSNLDEVRWLNQGGTRIGVVKGGRIVSWRRISAEEATKVLVQALINGDIGLLETVMATPDDLQALGLPEATTRKAAEGAAGRVAAVTELQKQLKGWDKQTTWSRFDGMMPHLIPDDAAPGLPGEITLYENGVIFVNPSRAGDPTKVAYLHVPEMVKVGETWKLVALPKAVDPSQPIIAELERGGVRDGIFVNGPAMAQGGGTTVPAALLEKLAAHDQKRPEPDAARNLAQWHLERIEVLREIINAAKDDDEKLTFYKQVVQDLADAYRSGYYPQGAQVFDRLMAMEGALGAKVAAFAEYHKIGADFDLEAEKPGADPSALVQENLKRLQAFLDKRPKADEVPVVMFQIANVRDFNGEEDEARAAYGQLASRFPDSDVGKKAAGALRRLDLDGKPLDLSGPALDGKTASIADFKGKTLLVLFWMSIAEPDKRELADLRTLHEKYRDKGFAVLTVNLDHDRALLDEYLKSASPPWPVIHEDGGLDGRLANEFGIISTPTMFLVDPQGKVVSHRIRKATEVEKVLEKPLAATPASFDLNERK